MIDDSNNLIFAWNQRLGGLSIQEDYFSHYHNECFVLADGVGSWQHGEIAAQDAGETAIWGYREIRKRRLYGIDKKLLLKRIFRTTNLSLWQKQKQPGYQDGLRTTLLVAIISQTKLWVGSVGDTTALLYRDELIDKLTQDERDQTGCLIGVLGAQRIGLPVQIISERFLPGDYAILTTDGVTDFIAEDQLRQILATESGSETDLQGIVDKLLDTAENNGSTGNMTACIIKKIN